MNISDVFLNMRRPFIIIHALLMKIDVVFIMMDRHLMKIPRMFMKCAHFFITIHALFMKTGRVLMKRELVFIRTARMIMNYTLVFIRMRLFFMGIRHAWITSTPPFKCDQHMFSLPCAQPFCTAGLLVTIPYEQANSARILLGFRLLVPGNPPFRPSVQDLQMILP